MLQAVKSPKYFKGDRGNKKMEKTGISLVVYFLSRSHIEAISHMEILFPSILLLLKRGNLVKYFESGTFVEKYIP